jgi:hypothetical protein
LVPAGGEDVEKGHRRVNIVKYCTHRYVNGKMRPVETTPGIGRVGNKGEYRGGEFNYD